jgi:hypothetical protein
MTQANCFKVLMGIAPLTNLNKLRCGLLVMSVVRWFCPKKLMSARKEKRCGSNS